MTSGENQYAGSDILFAPESQLAQSITSIVETEGPIHETDLMARVAAMWGTRAGARIASRIRGAMRTAEQGGLIKKRGDFFWNWEGKCIVRSRSGTRIPGDRIAPEEYETAVLQVLDGGHGFTEVQLVNEVRSVLGYSRTGAALEEGINNAIEALLFRKMIGKGSVGIQRRI
jgi:hypothetical protein